jgi:hypothetical protein
MLWKLFANLGVDFEERLGQWATKANRRKCGSGGELNSEMCLGSILGFRQFI